MRSLGAGAALGDGSSPSGDGDPGADAKETALLLGSNSALLLAALLWWEPALLLVAL